MPESVSPATPDGPGRSRVALGWPRRRASIPRRFGHPSDQEQDRVRINRQIRLSPVRLVGPDGNQLGIVPVEEARSKAEELGLDLVEVNPNIRPIVCRIMDYGRYKYDQQKSAKKSKSTATDLKQIKYRPNIDDHDFDTKTDKLRKFLSQGHKVRVTIMFRRRDMRRPENGIKLLHRVAEDLADVGKPDVIPKQVTSRDLTMTIFPTKQPSAKKSSEKEDDASGTSEKPSAAEGAAADEKESQPSAATKS